MKILVIDVGGTHVKCLATGFEEHRQFASGPAMTALEMIASVKRLSGDWEYEAVSIGYPGAVLHNRPALEPHNLGRGWVDFDFEKALGRPVKMVNDAALQALGCYRSGSMLFLGLGTGLGTALVVDGMLAPMELGHLPYRKDRTYEDYVGARGLKRLGEKKWKKHVGAVAKLLKAALEADDLVLGGGNTNKLKTLPAGARRVQNSSAFTGGFRLWDK